MALALTDIFSRSKDTVSRLMDASGDSVLLHLRSGYVYTCGEVGTCVWEALKKPAAVAEILRKVCGEFDVEEAVALGDLERFLGDLLAERLVTIDTKSHA